MFDPEGLQAISASNDKVNDKVKDERWNKVLLLREAIARILAHGTHSNSNAYVVWMDSDLIVVDMNMKMEQFTQSFPYAHFIMSKDFMQVSDYLILDAISDTYFSCWLGYD